MADYAPRWAGVGQGGCGSHGSGGGVWALFSGRGELVWGTDKRDGVRPSQTPLLLAVSISMGTVAGSCSGDTEGVCWSPCLAPLRLSQARGRRVFGQTLL